MIFELRAIGQAGRRAIGTALSLLVLIGTSGCTRFENVMASIPVFSFLRNSPGIDPYEMPRPAPPNAVPYASPAGDVPLPITPTVAGMDAFAATAVNPLPATDTTVLQAGKVMFERFCSVCHGPQGGGNGPILNAPGETGKVPVAPNLMLPTTVGRNDGYLYAVIAVGRGLMPAYGARMSNTERWATVNYLRHLQRQSGAAAAPAAPGAAGAAQPGR
ncbi:MAG: c-type cytochrome [Pseudomonas sp.]